MTSDAEVEHVFASLKQDDADGVFLASPHVRTRFHALIIDLAAKRRLPVVGNRAEWVERGALFSYNLDLHAIGKAAASRYVDRILKGAKPADLPVEEVSQFKLVVNGKTAKALGITIPQSILVQADRVIE